MTKFKIQPVTDQTIDALSWALERLAQDMQDPYDVAPTTLKQACLGAEAPCRGLIATRGSDIIGAALISPVFSTTYGSTGVYVSDLWVAKNTRGTGLGKALLQTAAEWGLDLWQATFLKLTVYADNTFAAQFYDRLGFKVAERDRSCLLSGTAFRSLLEAGE